MLDRSKIVFITLFLIRKFITDIDTRLIIGSNTAELNLFCGRYGGVTLWHHVIMYQLPSDKRSSIKRLQARIYLYYLPRSGSLLYSKQHYSQTSSSPSSFLLLSPPFLNFQKPRGVGKKPRIDPPLKTRAIFKQHSLAPAFFGAE